ncbi:hypothetical protein MACH09_42530 [Vibrio sp. MACH09]|uniref:hypothetical protein n=1 Tax=unclassified Vibrio TaxID=2614977 RepID=UPI0014936FAB|nr:MULTISPECIES: hypothetical protein [unclassified Vibrio]NOI66002.1 hypothetical protein [Vibrio sp. 99-8-1]GLO63745.1 hypothetical protein MACH09_42530 [Vibrio sp. MACH09]
MSFQDIVTEKKNQWLLSHVDVAYPTPESLAGKALYLKSQINVEYSQRTVQTKLTESKFIDDIYLVDFHRLTVMFAQLQASQWPNAEEQAVVLEFFAQISLSPDQPMYIGFKKGTPVICALLTAHNGDLLISDIATNCDDEEIKAQFADQLIEIVNSQYNCSSYTLALGQTSS